MAALALGCQFASQARQDHSKVQSMAMTHADFAVIAMWEMEGQLGGRI